MPSNPELTKGALPENMGAQSSPAESRLATLEQRINTLLSNLEKEKQAVETAKQEQKPEDKPTTAGDVQAALNKLTASIAMALNRVSNSVDGKIRDLGNIYATQDQAKQLAHDAVPIALQDLNDASNDLGDTLMRNSGGESGSDYGYWGTVAASGSGFDWSKVAFGYKLNGTAGDSSWTVTIKAGRVDGIDVPEATRTVFSSPNTYTYIYVKRTLLDDSMEIVAIANARANLDDGIHRYYQLYRFQVDLVKKIVSLQKAWRPFNIEERTVANGTAANPHLVWDDTEKEWGIGEITGLPGGGINYQVIQKQSGVAVWDWTRWVVVI